MLNGCGGGLNDLLSVIVQASFAGEYISYIKLKQGGIYITHLHWDTLIRMRKKIGSLSSSGIGPTLNKIIENIKYIGTTI